MSWLEAITSSIKYMEEHLTDDITAEQVAVGSKHFFSVFSKRIFY